MFSGGEEPSSEIVQYCQSLNYSTNIKNNFGVSQEFPSYKTVVDQTSPMFHTYIDVIQDITLIPKPFYLDLLSLCLSNGLNSPLYKLIREDNQLAYLVYMDFVSDPSKSYGYTYLILIK